MPPRSLALFAPLFVLAAAACSSTPSPPDAQRDAALDAITDATLDAPADAPPDAPVLPAQFTVFVAHAQLDGVGDWATQTREARVTALESASPRDELTSMRGDGIRVAAVADLAGCHECYRLEHASGGYVVRGDGVLGLQYGLTHLLEAHGYRFFHPFAGHAPADPATATVDPSAFDHDFVPEQRVRGLHFHTLHPVEALAFWTPSPERLAQAHAILDWTIRNRGNYVQIAALDNILTPSSAAAWRPHMRAILDIAHQRGIRAGINVQLFGGSSLQHAVTLLPDAADPNPETTIRTQLHAVFDGLTFDSVNISFGEFSGVDPDVFVSRLNLAVQVLNEIMPGIEVTATVHVGNYPNLQVTYMGQMLQYYYLVQFADPRIVPWVHTVMYYTLFDDAGGAYNSADFSTHRAFLERRLANHQRVAYHPESAYWVAFDNSIPQYLPVYIHSRWRDMAQLRADARAMGTDDLTEHVEFSTGMEWGYWQTDAAVLRMGFHLPDTWQSTVEDMFAPWGDAGHQMAQQVGALGDLQFDALITHRLAPYIAGRDVLIDAGESMRGITSQPTRPSFDAVAHMDATARATFATDVIDRLDALAAGSDAVRHALDAIPGNADDPWLSELRDGAAVDSARAHFAAAVWRAAERFGATGSDDGNLARAEAALADATTAVAHRHAHLNWPEPMRLLMRGSNPTRYPFGYLYFADSLCYWARELEQVRALVQGRTANPPGCIILG